MAGSVSVRANADIEHTQHLTNCMIRTFHHYIHLLNFFSRTQLLQCRQIFRLFTVMIRYLCTVRFRISPVSFSIQIHENFPDKVRLKWLSVIKTCRGTSLPTLSNTPSYSKSSHSLKHPIFDRTVPVTDVLSHRVIPMEVKDIDHLPVEIPSWVA